MKIILEYRGNKKEEVTEDFAKNLLMVRLEYDSEEWEFQDALKAIHGSKSYGIIGEIWQQVFRPNFKHGYDDTALDSEAAYEIIDKLSDRYREVLDDNDHTYID